MTTTTAEMNSTLQEYLSSPVKFHLAMLGISLTAGTAYGGFVAYSWWKERKTLVSHVGNLMLALVLRCFFTILVESVLWNSSYGWANALLSFECIFSNAVLGFWLILTVHVHYSARREFKKEPESKVYRLFGILGVSVFFALVWIFVMENQYPTSHWYANDEVVPALQWVTDSVRLLYLLVQLGLTIDAGVALKAGVSDNDSSSILKKLAGITAAMVLVFWLQFGFRICRSPQNESLPYLYFSNLIDGLQCATLCPLLFFFEKWVSASKSEETPRTSNAKRQLPRTETLADRNRERPIFTLDSAFATREIVPKKEETKDIVYTSLVRQEKLKRVIELHERFDSPPAAARGGADRGEFYDCFEEDGDSEDGRGFWTPKRASVESNDGSSTVLQDPVQKPKKNAFYVSKYLVSDREEKQKNHPG